MRKPTKYQRRWMEQMSYGAVLIAGHDSQFYLKNVWGTPKVNKKSAMIVIRNGWVRRTADGFVITPAGREALK